MREMPQPVPKPMAVIGYRPLLWHLMKYYSHYGHHDFILCLGYGGDVIKEAFLNYNECVSNDFVLSRGGKKIELCAKTSKIGESLLLIRGKTQTWARGCCSVRKFIGDDEVFLANYADGLSDLPLPKLLTTSWLAEKSVVSRESLRRRAFIAWRWNLTGS